MFLSTGTVLHGEAYDYVIESVLGHGTFGVTYKASVRLRGKLGSLRGNLYVAIKEFFLQGASTRDGSTLRYGSQIDLMDRCLSRFRKEAQLISRLNHPGIVKVMEEFEENDTAYYVMELIEGESLSSRIQSKGPLAEDECVRITKALCDALDYMHSSDMLHLDLKPSNIMLRTDGSPVLIDFGLSKVFNDETDDTFLSLANGTPGYASIEQAAYSGSAGEYGQPVTMDVYSLGATMYNMLSGVRPPSASMVLNRGLDTAPLRCSSALKSVVTKAMRPIVSERYPDMKALKADLPGEIKVLYSVFRIPDSAKVLRVDYLSAQAPGGRLPGSFSVDVSRGRNTEDVFLTLIEKLNALNIILREDLGEFKAPAIDTPERFWLTYVLPNRREEGISLSTRNYSSRCNFEIENIDELVEKTRQIFLPFIDKRFYEIKRITPKVKKVAIHYHGFRENDYIASITVEKANINGYNYVINRQRYDRFLTLLCKNFSEWIIQNSELPADWYPYDNKELQNTHDSQFILKLYEEGKPHPTLLWVNGLQESHYGNLDMSPQQAMKDISDSVSPLYSAGKYDGVGYASAFLILLLFIILVLFCIF